jgi:isopenicillin N synthase-like dioxygenase
MFTYNGLTLFLSPTDPQWYSDIAKKRAAYSGHTDIGSVTYLYANPVASLQVYTREGWQYVAYIPNSIVVNMGDAMEFITQGRMNATLHRGRLFPIPIIISYIPIRKTF